jgi:hypothetical protein
MQSWSCRLAAHTLVVCLLAAGTAQGQTGRGWKKAWIASVAALVTVNVLDAHSSAGHYETNPLLQNSQGRFSTGRAIAVKSVASGGLILVQLLLRRRNPEQGLEKTSAIVNFAAAGALGATAYRNTRVP